MKTIFLAAGRSSRMDPISDKNFLSFGGEPLILKLLKNAHKGGLDNFIIVGNKHNYESLKVIKTQNEFLKNSIITTQSNLDEGMAGGVLAGLEYVKSNDTVFVLGGNDLVDYKIYQELITNTEKHDGSILGKAIDTYFPGGYLEVDNDQCITSIVEKPAPGTEPSNLINIVAHGFKKSETLKKALINATSDKDDLYEVALDTCFKDLKFKVVKYTGSWKAIKYPWHILEMSEIFMNQKYNLCSSSEYTEIKPRVWIHKTALVSDRVTIKGENIVIEAGAKIYENAVICGPCYIGKEVIIGNGSLIREANIEKKCVIGYNTEIARSYLAENVSTHIAYVGDSIIDKNVNFGAYSCTANLRLDQKDVGVKIKGKLVDSQRKKLGTIAGDGVQIGVGAKLMPGSKIPCKTLISPNEVFKS